MSLAQKTLRIFVPHCSDMLTDHLPNGDGQIAYGFLRQLALNGHELHVATPRLEVRETIHPNLHPHVIMTSLTGAPGRLEYMARVRRLFIRLRRDIPFQLLYQTNPVFAGVSLALTGSGLPLVLGTYVSRGWTDPETISARRGTVGTILRWGRDQITWLQQQQADLLLLTAPAAFDRLPNQGAGKRKIRWIGHGIDQDLFCPALGYLSEARLEIEQANPTVLFLGRAVLHKGILALVRTWKLVLAQLPNARLHVAGDGPDLERMKLLAGELCISDQITFIGRVSREQAPDLYRRHSIYVLPSFDEPYATSVLEAMSCGRPIITTNTGGTPSMLPEAGCLLVPPNDPELLAAAIVRLLRDPLERRAMAAANRAHVLKSMTWPKTVEVLEGYFREAMQMDD